MYYYKRKTHAGLKLIIAILIVVFAIFGLAYWRYGYYINTPVDPNDSTKVSFQIKKGETIEEIAENLEDKGMILSNWAFYMYVRFNDFDKNIIYGRFLLNKSLNIKEIASIFTDPAKAEYVITIQEGLTIKDIEEKLIDFGLVEKGEFLNEVKKFEGWEYYSFLDQKVVKFLTLPLEGYLFPDTYFLNPVDFKPYDLIYLALDNFEKKFEELKKYIKNRSISEILTMASIIEKEVTGEKDRKIVSGILWKRLDNGWILGADAAILYVTEDRIITNEDLKIDSPYNIRKYRGLPPGPICNPSIESIKAAIFPQESDYWYYLTAKDTGEVIYGKTNEEHNLNRRKYL